MIILSIKPDRKFYNLKRSLNNFADRRPATLEQARKQALWIFSAQIRVLLALKSGMGNIIHHWNFAGPILKDVKALNEILQRNFAHI